MVEEPESDVLGLLTELMIGAGCREAVPKTVVVIDIVMVKVFPLEAGSPVGADESTPLLLAVLATDSMVVASA